MPRPSYFVSLLAVSSVLIALTFFLGYVVRRDDFPVLVAAYGLFWGLYGYVLLNRGWPASAYQRLVGLGIMLRIILLFNLPNLSDDFYRFLWDGRLTVQGIHPFAHPPAYFMEPQHAIPGLAPDLFQHLNSPAYYTVYPPVCQAVFWLAAKLYPDSIAGSVFVLKLFLLGCELGTLFLLNFKFKILNLKFKSVAYALNPLALFEIVGNCHFEGAMLCFLLAGCWALSRQRVALAAAFWALATASKLLPLLFLPVLVCWLDWRRAVRFMLVFTGTCLVLFLPLLEVQAITNMANSLNLYFRQFEFNASIYYLFKAIGADFAPPTLDVARTLGPLLGLTVALGVTGIAFYTGRVNVKPGAALPGVPDRELVLANRLTLALTLYLALATTVHPWYVVPLFGLSLLTRWQYPLVWTAGAFLSYSHYASGGFREHFGWITLEYAVVLLAFAWDMFRHRNRTPS